MFNHNIRPALCVVSLGFFSIYSSSGRMPVFAKISLGVFWDGRGYVNWCIGERARVLRRSSEHSPLVCVEG